jgi:nitrogen PTS system EIIA component
MDLTIKDVAKLLNVSYATIRRWLKQGKIPGYKLGNQIRFARNEIEDWIVQSKIQKDDIPEKIDIKSSQAKEILSRKIGTNAYSLYRALYKGSVLNNIKNKTKDEVIKESVNIIANDLSLDASVLTDLLLDREKLMPTALNHGIAVPHTRDFLLPQSFDIIYVVYLTSPIEFGALDGQKVDTLFFLFACDDKSHLNLLAKIAHLARDDGALDFIREHPSKADLLNYVKNFEAKLRSSSLEKV